MEKEEYYNNSRSLEYYKKKGKAYKYNTKLIYEGKFLNEKRNEKGKEYYVNKGVLLFEGEYLYGKNRIKKDMIKMEILNSK